MSRGFEGAGASVPLLEGVTPMNLAWLGADGKVHSVNQNGMKGGFRSNIDRAHMPLLEGARAPIMVGTSAATYAPVSII